MDDVRALKARVRWLEDELMRRPQRGDVEHVRERLRRKERMYEAAIARNQVLRRKLDEVGAA